MYIADHLPQLREWNKKQYEDRCVGDYTSTTHTFGSSMVIVSREHHSRSNFYIHGWEAVLSIANTSWRLQVWRLLKEDDGGVLHYLLVAQSRVYTAEQIGLVKHYFALEDILHVKLGDVIGLKFIKDVPFYQCPCDDKNTSLFSLNKLKHMDDLTPGDILIGFWSQTNCTKFSMKLLYTEKPKGKLSCCSCKVKVMGLINGFCVMASVFIAHNLLLKANSCYRELKIV